MLGFQDHFYLKKKTLKADVDKYVQRQRTAKEEKENLFKDKILENQIKILKNQN